MPGGRASASWKELPARRYQTDVYMALLGLLSALRDPARYHLYVLLGTQADAQVLFCAFWVLGIGRSLVGPLVSRVRPK